MSATPAPSTPATVPPKDNNTGGSSAEPGGAEPRSNLVRAQLDRVLTDPPQPPPASESALSLYFQPCTGARAALPKKPLSLQSARGSCRSPRGYHPSPRALVGRGRRVLPLAPRLARPGNILAGPVGQTTAPAQRAAEAAQRRAAAAAQWQARAPHSPAPRPAPQPPNRQPPHMAPVT